MTERPHIWLRAEARPTERRTPLTPDGVRTLLEDGFRITVERSATRIIADKAYEETGCGMAEAGSWTAAPSDAIILGLKELPDEPDTLEHTHIFFGHAYKDQRGWREFLERFRRGGGRLLDIEYMTDEDGRRVAAFGYWAGYMGSALALQHWLSRNKGGSVLDDGLSPYEDADALDREIRELASGNARPPRVVVIGALGRSGRGACDLAERHGAEVTRWDVAETRPLDRAALLDHDIFVNCALVTEKIEPFLTRRELEAGHRLSVISDVSCDPTSDINPLPFYDAATEWDAPYLTIGAHGGKGVDLIAIDNLPSLLPRESSEDFAGLLLPHLRTLSNDGFAGVWQNSHSCFGAAMSRASTS